MRWLDSNNTPRKNLCLIHRQLPREAADHGRQQTAHLGLGEALADAAPRPVEEGQELVVALGAAVGVGLAGCDPALGAELAGLVAPNLGRPVHLPHGQDERDALGDGLPADVGVADGLAHGDGDRGVEAQRLIHDAVEVGQGLEQGAHVCGFALVFVALESLADFVT